MIDGKLIRAGAVMAGLMAAAPAFADDAVHLDYWVYSDFAQGEALKLQQSFIDGFTAEHPGLSITISGRGDDALLTGEIAGAASKTGPDVFMNSTALGATLVKAGALKNVYDDWMAMPESFRKQFNPELIKVCTPKPGTMYCLPYTGYASLLFRNLTVLEKAGIDPSEPIRNWDDWKAQMAKVKAAGMYAMPDMSQTWFGLANMYSGAAGPDDWGIDFDANKTLIKADKLAATTQYMVDIKPYSTDASDDDQVTKDLFISDKLAFLPGGPWINPIFEKAAKESGLKYDWVLIPGKETGKPAGVKGYELIGVAPNAHADIAWQFAAYVAEKKQMARWAAALGRYNSNDEALADPSVVSNPLLKSTVEAAKNAIFNRPPFFVKAYPADYFSVLLDDVAAIMDGDESPADGAAAAVEDLNADIAAN